MIVSFEWLLSVRNKILDFIQAIDSFLYFFLHLFVWVFLAYVWTEPWFTFKTVNYWFIFKGYQQVSEKSNQSKWPQIQIGEQLSKTELLSFKRR